MAQEIYNEGRVVGLSAWEIFYKEAIGKGIIPDNIPAEPQWLASMIGMGNSMILRIPAGTSAGIHDFEVPQGCNLSAAGVVIANPFMGTCTWDTSNWATKVTSYSSLVLNTDVAGKNPPVTGSNTVPCDDSSYTTGEFFDCVTEFTKLADGVVFVKNADWIPTPVGEFPEKDIDPNFNESAAVVRIYLSSATQHDVAVLLTGFTNKRILQTVSGYAVEGDAGVRISGSTDVENNDWMNGGMLGPEIIPWASKIVFMVPSAAYTLANSLSRTIPSDATYSDITIADAYTFKDVSDTIRANSLIDFNSITLTDYYNQHSFTKDPTLQENVSKVSIGAADGYNTLTAWYPGMSAAEINATAAITGPDADAKKKARFFPPALYATQITSAGDKILVPIDTAAPGTVKGFTDATQAYNYKVMVPDNYAIYNNVVNNTFSFATSDSDPNTWAGTAKIDYIDAPKAEVTAGNQKAKFVALTYYDNGTYTDYPLGGTAGLIKVGPIDKLTWANMLDSLKTNKALDVLGQGLRNLGTELEASNTIGITNKINTVGADTIILKAGSSPNVAVSVTANQATTDSTKLATFAAGTSIKTGTNFIEFANGLRLYISATNPGTAGVPDGSIGIGWEY